MICEEIVDETDIYNDNMTKSMAMRSTSLNTMLG